MLALVDPSHAMTPHRIRQDRPRTTLPRRHGAFSLIELLVVIAVVALLLGILLPALGRARQAALGVRCLSNLRQSALAQSMYMDDHAERFPWGTPPPGAADPENPFAWYALRTGYGWGGVHWHGFDAAGDAVVIDEDRAITARPANPYFELPETSPGFGDIFRCPAENGVTRRPDPMFPDRPWPFPFGDLGENNLSDFPDTIYGATGTSYHMWAHVYQPDGLEPGARRDFIRPEFGSRARVSVSHARFVLLGDWPQLAQAAANRIEPVSGAPVPWPNWRYYEGWWHGFAKGNFAYLDGSARSTDLTGPALSYTLARTYDYPTFRAPERPDP